MSFYQADLLKIESWIEDQVKFQVIHEKSDKYQGNEWYFDLERSETIPDFFWTPFNVIFWCLSIQSDYERANLNYFLKFKLKLNKLFWCDNAKDNAKNSPRPGIEPGPPGWKPGILTPRPSGTDSCSLYLNFKSVSKNARFMVFWLSILKYIFSRYHSYQSQMV